MLDAIRSRVATRRGERATLRERVFTQNGGAVYYESLYVSDGGLVEGATPECRGPSQLLLYQRAQDRLLELAVRKIPGDFGLLKNCRDAEGHLYASQENFSVDIAEGPALWALRAGLVALAPAVLLTVLATWTMLLVAVLGMALAGIAALMWTGGRARLARARLGADARPSRPSTDPRRAQLFWLKGAFWLELGLRTPVDLLFAGLLRACAFRRIRREGLAFLASRPIVTGAGSLDADDRLQLSERAAGLRRTMRVTSFPGGRAFFDTGNQHKALLLPMLFDFGAPLALFRRSQRMQLGLGDANRCQIAEYLKIGTTLLVIDAIEAGALTGAPRLRDPVGALHAYSADPTLTATAPIRGGAPMTALAIQRWYWRAVSTWVDQAPVVSLEARDLVRMWGAALDALETDREQLVGRLDWVTKAALLDPEMSPAARKKLDLEYHELGRGPVPALEAAGLSPMLVTDEEIERAIDVPPHETPASQRGRLVQQLADADIAAVVSWSRIKLRAEGKIIRLDDYR